MLLAEDDGQLALSSRGCSLIRQEVLEPPPRQAAVVEMDLQEALAVCPPAETSAPWAVSARSLWGRRALRPLLLPALAVGA